MNKHPNIKRVATIRKNSTDPYSGNRIRYGETANSLIAAEWCNRCDQFEFVLVIHKTSPKTVLNPYLNNDGTPVHERIDNVWRLVGREHVLAD